MACLGLRSCSLLLRVRVEILRGARVPYNSAQHEPYYGENEPDVSAREVLVVLRESAAAAKPGAGALSDAALAWHLEALDVV
jgi:hypothetical protein